jgi:hypothetical protein
MVVAMGEDETFAPSCTRGQRVTTQSRGDTIERTVVSVANIPTTLRITDARWLHLRSKASRPDAILTRDW